MSQGYSVKFLNTSNGVIEAVEGPFLSLDDAFNYSFWSLQTQCGEEMVANIVEGTESVTDTPELSQEQIDSLTKRIHVY